MKKLNVVLMIFLATVVLAPVVQADLVLDQMTLGALVSGTTDPPPARTGIPGRWVDLRSPPFANEGSGYLQDSAVSAPGAAIQDGSMRIDYSGQPAGSQWDREIAGYFDVGLYAPDMPDLSDGFNPYVPDPTLAFTFCMWTAGTVDGVVAPERLRELQIYSPGKRALFQVENYNESDPVGGWTCVSAPLTSFVPDAGFDWSAINEVKFWFSSWKGDAPDWIADPVTGSSVYVDDFRLIPEPATMSLLALGALAMLKRRRA
ncbi:MAG: PEP-CTERM sorting domain-containing protein [Sedimentisphaerales bacterium]